MTAETLLLRQIHPNFILNGFAGSVAFRPNDSDGGMMSVYDGDLISPLNAWIHYTTEQRLKSSGTMAISVEECDVAGLPARPDPEPFLEHAVVDFTGLDAKQCRNVSKKLQAKAIARGWLHRADQSA